MIFLSGNHFFLSSTTFESFESLSTWIRRSNKYVCLLQWRRITWVSRKDPDKGPPCRQFVFLKHPLPPSLTSLILILYTNKILTLVRQPRTQFRQFSREPQSHFSRSKSWMWNIHIYIKGLQSETVRKIVTFYLLSFGREIHFTHEVCDFDFQFIQF